MTFMDRAIAGSIDIWDNCLNHPFIQEMAQGTLDEELFKNYIIQDSIYLKEYARVFAMAMYKSTTLEDIRAYYSILGFVNDSESNTRIKYLHSYGLTDQDVENTVQKPQNKAYTDFMLETAQTEDTPEILMAVLPCMISYGYIGEYMASLPNVKESKYWDMIYDYISDNYKDCCNRWTAFANNKCENLPEDRQQKLIKIFRTASEHEMHFWNMSYNI